MVDTKIVLNEFGKIVDKMWSSQVNDSNNNPINAFQHIIPRSVGSIIRGFKIGVTKWFRVHTAIIAVWQKNYYEHIIRNEVELKQIRRYIINNHRYWSQDEENPLNFK